MNRFAANVGLALLALLFSLPSWATIHHVAVSSFSFSPGNVTVQHGDTVRWTYSSGSIGHNVHETTLPNLFNSGVPAPAPWTFDFVPADTVDPGTYHYVCDLHAPGMSGNVIVEAGSASPEPPSVVTDLRLEQNYPNPFNNETAIRFSVPFATDVQLSVLNVLGQPVSQIFSGPLSSGTHQFLFDASRLSSGMYYYRLETPRATLARKMYLVK